MSLPSRFQKEVNTHLSRNPQPPGSPQSTASEGSRGKPYNTAQVQVRLQEILARYSNGFWVSKLPQIYKETYKQEFPAAALADLEAWTHICISTASEGSRGKPYNTAQVQVRLQEILARYSNGFWVSKLPQIYKETYKQEFPAAALADLEAWTHICIVEKPCSSARPQLLLYPAKGPATPSTPTSSSSSPSPSPSPSSSSSPSSPAVDTPADKPPAQHGRRTPTTAAAAAPRPHSQSQSYSPSSSSRS
ncbi:hypothetical protein CRUP_024072, partial [Coryphaenoides rupestris]